MPPFAASSAKTGVKPGRARVAGRVQHRHLQLGAAHWRCPAALLRRPRSRHGFQRVRALALPITQSQPPFSSPPPSPFLLTLFPSQPRICLHPRSLPPFPRPCRLRSPPPPLLLLLVFLYPSFALPLLTPSPALPYSLAPSRSCPLPRPPLILSALLDPSLPRSRRFVSRSLSKLPACF